MTEDLTPEHNSGGRRAYDPPQLTTEVILLHLQALDARLRAQFDGLNALVTGVGDRVASVDDRLNIQNGRVFKTIEDLAVVQLHVAVAQATIKDLSRKVATTERRMITLASAASAIVATIANQAWVHLDAIRGALLALGVTL